MWPTLKWATTWSGGVGLPSWSQTAMPPITVDMVNELIQEMRREREDRWLGVMDKGGEKRVALRAGYQLHGGKAGGNPRAPRARGGGLDRHLTGRFDGHRGAHAA